MRNKLIKNKMNKKNKKGFVFIGTLIVILIIVGVLVILPLFSGTLTFPALDKIPAPVWVVLLIILLFKLIGGKKK